MTEKRDRERAQGGSLPKREYLPPAVTETAAFETLALSCGKTVGDFGCITGTGETNS